MWKWLFFKCWFGTVQNFFDIFIFSFWFVVIVVSPSSLKDNLFEEIWNIWYFDWVNVNFRQLCVIVLYGLHITKSNFFRLKLTNWAFNSILFRIHHNTSVKNSHFRYLRISSFIFVCVKNVRLLDKSLFCSKTEASENIEVPTSTSGIWIYKWKCDCTTWSYSFAISFLFAYWIFARKT